MFYTGLCIDEELCLIVDGENFFLPLLKDIWNIPRGYREYDPYVLVPKKRGIRVLPFGRPFVIWQSDSNGISRLEI